MVDVGNLETLDSLGAKVCFLFSQFSIFWPNSSKQIYSLIKPRLQWRRNVGADTFRHNRVFTTTTNLGRKLRWIRHENCDEMSSQSRVYNGDEFVTNVSAPTFRRNFWISKIFERSSQSDYCQKPLSWPFSGLIFFHWRFSHMMNRMVYSFLRKIYSV